MRGPPSSTVTSMFRNALCGSQPPSPASLSIASRSSGGCAYIGSSARLSLCSRPTPPFHPHTFATPLYLCRPQRFHFHFHFHFATTTTMMMPRLATSMLSLPIILLALLAGHSAEAAASAADISSYLSAHNSVRAQHGASNLVWNVTLAIAAQSWVNRCKFQHSGGSLGPFGGAYT